MNLSELPTRWRNDSPHGGIVLPSDFRLTGAAGVEAPIRRASVGWKAVHLVRVLAFEACLGAEPSVSSLPPHKIKFELRSLPNQAHGQYMDASVLHAWRYSYICICVCMCAWM